MRFTLEGDATIVGPLVNFKSDVEAGYLTPDAVIIGYAWQATDALLLEADINWRNWTDLGTAVIYMKDPNPLTGTKTSVTRRNWRNAGELAVGAKYTVNENWALDGGLMYSMTPVREEYATLEIPDSNYYLVSAGPVFSDKNISVSMPIAFLTNFKKDINSGTAIYNGEWNLSVLHFGLNLSWVF